MKRRDFIAVLGGTVGWSLVARAQKSAMPVIGFLSSASPAQWTRNVVAFRQGLNEAGYAEGKNVAIEYRWAEGHYDRLPALAADLVSGHVAVLVATGGPDSALAAKEATSTIPIVFTTGGDPVQLGVVASLGHPGGNATGVYILTGDLNAKRLGLLHEMVPRAATIATLINPTNAGAQVSRTRSVRLRPQLGFSRLSCAPAPSATSTPHSRSSSRNGSARSSSATIRFSMSGASNSWRWRHATQCQQSLNYASSSPPAA
jgi:putative tryptophan/tyrosine transport system substrate-binding protein